MTTTAQNLTDCTVCGRTVGAKRSWERDQSGQPAQWKVTRHRSNERRRYHGTETICGGTGIVVDASAVRPRDSVSA